MKGYYFVTDSKLSRAGNVSDVQNAVAAGVEVVQYRRKDASTAELFAEAAVLRKLGRQTIFLVNDRVDIALAVQADGVHLGQEDLPLPAARKLLGRGKIIGLTVHSFAEARQAEVAGADYLGVSPIFTTQTKADAGQPAGIELIRQIRSAVKIPLIAIGGINLANAPEVIRAGADGLCAISAVVSGEDVRAEIEKFQRLFRSLPLKVN
ncbi:MAG: thiamine phosphate synthase [Verrucomicrobiia bacterium]|jgi:thiamine-phosphate pyrophosphorylase